MQNVDHMQELENLLKEVLAELVRQEYENRPKHFKRHFFSLRFRRKMRRMIKQVNAERRAAENASPITDLYRPIHSKRKWLIMLALLLALVGGTVTGAEPVICRLFEYCMEQHGNFVEMEQGEDNRKMAEDSFQKYELLVLRQSLQENGNHGNTTSIREEMEKVQINDFQGYFVEDFDTSSLVLSDGKYMIEIFGSLSKEELLSLAENLRFTR